MRLEAFIYIRGELYRIVNLLNDKDSGGEIGEFTNEMVQIELSELEGEFTPVVYPEYLSIGEIQEVKSLETYKLIHKAKIDNRTVDNLIGENELEIQIISDSKKVEMIHIYEMNHPIHPWDSYDFFEYENDIEEFNRLLFCYAKSFVFGQYLQIHFASYPVNEKTESIVEEWKAYRESRELLYFEGIYLTQETINRILEEGE